MVEFESIRLKDTGPFKDTTFEFKSGLSIVYGLNRAGGKFSTNANAAGKSYLLSQLAEILYEEPVVGERQDKVKSGNRSVTFKAKGKHITIGRMGSKIKIKVDGKLKKFRTPTIARAYIKKLMPISKEEFGTYVYLDSRVPHPLVMGSSTDRKRFFNSFFGLDKIDAERKLFKARLTELEQIKSAYDELNAEYKRSTANLINFEQNEELKAKVESGEALIKKLQGRLVRMQEVKRLVSFVTSSKDSIKALKAACGEITLEAFEKCSEETRWHLKKDEEELEDALLWEQYQRDNKAYTEAVAALSDNARKYLTKRKKAKLGSSKYVEVKTRLNSVKEELDSIEETDKPKRVEKPEGKKLDVQVLVKTYLDQLSHASKFEDGKCETCGQDVKVNPKEIRRKLKEVEGRLTAFEAYEEFEQALSEYKKNVARRVELAAEVDELQTKCDKYKSYYKAYKELRDLPSKPEPFEGKRLESKIKKQMVEEDRARLQLLDFCRPHLDTIIEYLALSKADKEAVKDLDSLQDNINRVQEKLAALKAKLEIQATLRKNARSIKARLETMKEDLKDEQPLRLLIEAYSDKAMKKIAVKAISSRLMKVVNKYARSVFPEDYQFEFRWDTSQLSLLVHRKYGKKTSVSDVRKLSGAESKLFTLILLPALLSFVPTYKRSNLLVLDEPSANMSEETTVSFQKLLPVLNKFIPSIVVITPKSKEMYEGASNFTVYKENGASSLIKGHPLTLASTKMRGAK